MKSLSRSTLVISLFLAALSLGATASAQDPQPEAAVLEPLIDVGSAPRGTAVSARFTIENRGQATLVFGDSRDQCNCTEVMAPDIAAGESGEVQVTVDTAKMSGPAQMNVRIQTNDPKAPSLSLTVKVFSQDMLVAHPGYYRFLVHQNFTGGGKIRQVVAATDNSDFEITGIEAPYSFLKIGTIEPAAEEERVPNLRGSQWAFELQLDNKADVGPLAGTIDVETNHPSQKILPIPISGFVRPVSAFTPSSLEFGRFTPQPAGYRDIHFKQFAAEPMEITKISTELDGFTFQPVVVEEGRTWRIRVYPSVDLAKGPFRGTVTVETTSIYQPKTSFEIKGVVE